MELHSQISNKVTLFTKPQYFSIFSDILSALSQKPLEKKPHLVLHHSPADLLNINQNKSYDGWSRLYSHMTSLNASTSQPEIVMKYLKEKARNVLKKLSLLCITCSMRMSEMVLYYLFLCKVEIISHIGANNKFNISIQNSEKENIQKIDCYYDRKNNLSSIKSSVTKYFLNKNQNGSDTTRQNNVFINVFNKKVGIKEDAIFTYRLNKKPVPKGKLLLYSKRALYGSTKRNSSINLHDNKTLISCSSTKSSICMTTKKNTRSHSVCMSCKAEDNRKYRKDILPVIKFRN